MLYHIIKLSRLEYYNVISCKLYRTYIYKDRNIIEINLIEIQWNFLLSEPLFFVHILIVFEQKIFINKNKLIFVIRIN